jgi:hypothetical protein
LPHWHWALQPAQTLMIPSNAASAGAYWERLLALLLEQRRAAGRGLPSGRQSEGQQGYLAESLLHLHRHRAPITAIQPTAIRFTGILLTGYPAYGYPSHPPSGYGYPGYSAAPGYPGSATYDYQGDARYPTHPGSPRYGTPGDLAQSPYSDFPSHKYQSPPLYPPEAGFGSGYPGFSLPGYRTSEDWLPGAEHAVEPSTRVSA